MNDTIVAECEEFAEDLHRRIAQELPSCSARSTLAAFSGDQWQGTLQRTSIRVEPVATPGGALHLHHVLQRHPHGEQLKRLANDAPTAPP